MNDKIHAKLSPSGAKRWLTCPGSVKLCESIATLQEPNRYAAEGTVAHEIGERCLRGEALPSDFLGKKMEADGFTFTVNGDMIEAVKFYVDYVEDIISNPFDSEISLEVEVFCSLKKFKIPGLDGGTSDAVIINKSEKIVEIIDYKHGAGVAVDVDDNYQLMSYALGCLIHIGVKSGTSAAFDWGIKTTIVQPRAFHPDGIVRSQIFKASDIYKWADTVLVPGAKLTLDSDAPLVPSDDGCRWCPAMSSCPALHRKTQEIAMVDFSDFAPDLPNPTLLSNSQKLKVALWAPLIKEFITACQKSIEEEIINGSKDYEEHFKLVKARTQRKLTELAEDPISSPLLDYLDEDEIFNKKVKGIGELEKHLKNKIGKKQAGEVINAITEKPEGALTIAPISDKRVAVENLTAQEIAVSAFKHLED